MAATLVLQEHLHFTSLHTSAKGSLHMAPFAFLVPHQRPVPIIVIKWSGPRPVMNGGPLNLKPPSGVTLKRADEWCCFYKYLTANAYLLLLAKSIFKIWCTIKLKRIYFARLISLDILPMNASRIICPASIVLPCTSLLAW